MRVIIYCLVTEQLIGMPLKILGESLGCICCKVVLPQARILPWQLCNHLVDPAVLISSPVIYCEDDVNEFNKLLKLIIDVYLVHATHVRYYIYFGLM